AAAELRRREAAGEHTPIIAMTAAAFAEDRARCLAAGMDDYLAKPINPGLLDATLTRWTSGFARAAPTTATADGVTEAAEAVQAALAQLGADRLGADRLGADRLGADRLGADR